ncbi:MAG TPA: molybdopterin-synthase adenylyltransferase MoeB [Rhizomicrobium sp.]|nr:molybdopterin-synthase adenylyltransferase MoeB [Rhizomicrobium sp.]
MTMSDEELDRYARHLVLREVGGVGQAKIRAARVLIVGAGGLGSPAALYLAAAGVGCVGIADDDAVSLSNLQRQILFATKDVGRPKVDAAAEHLRALNPGVRVIPHHTRLTNENVDGLIEAYDIVADGSDNFETRFLLNDACFAARKVLVSAAVTEFDGQLATFKAWDKRGAYPCYRCLFPEPPPSGTVPSCSEAGVLGAAAGVMGSLQALEVLKQITGMGENLAGKILIADTLAWRFRTVTLAPDPKCRLCG